jgi:hypothetical protein
MRLNDLPEEHALAAHIVRLVAGMIEVSIEAAAAQSGELLKS